MKRSANTKVLARAQLQVLEELPARLRPVGEEMRIGIFLIRELLPGNAVSARVLLDLRRAQSVDLRRVEAEDLGADRGRDLRVAVSIPQLRRDLKSAERLDRKSVG